MNKQKTRAFGHDIYFLGVGENGLNYYLQAAQWDCGWYWGGGYVRAYTNNHNPARARDVLEHRHFDSLFLNGGETGLKKFKNFFKNTPFTDNEIWKICELMKSFYICRDYSDTIHRGGANYTTNPAAGIIKNDDEYNRINNTVIPAIMTELYKILEG